MSHPISDEKPNTQPSIDARFNLSFEGFSLDVDLHLPDHGVTALFGHSGSGKTSLLRCIAGLLRTPEGFLCVNGEHWQTESSFTPPHKRPIGYVFQEASLFEHLTVAGNLNFARKRASNTNAVIEYEHALELLGIEHLLTRMPAQLSGGERQRVAIARALLIQPQLLLMDEPLAALDVSRKQEILPHLERLKQELKLPIIYVSHAADEVARLADYLVVMQEGRVTSTGTLLESLTRLDLPLHLGDDTGAVLEGTIAERDSEWQLVRVAFNGGSVWLRDTDQPIGSHVRVRILARDISLASEHHQDTSILNILPATVVEIGEDQHDGSTLVKLSLGASAMLSRISRRSAHNLSLKPGLKVWAQIKSIAVL